MTEPSRAVFLSYASQDAEAAKRICDALRAAGVEVWFDQSELRGGDSWDQQIRREIHDCALFVPVISGNTATRHEGYFRLEWDLADQRTHMIARNRAFVVPVCLDATPDAGADVPDSFQRVQWTRLPAGETPPAFVERIVRLLSPDQPQAATQPLAPAVPAPAPRQPAASTTAARKSQRVPLLIALAAAAIGIGYFALDKLVQSKRPVAAAQASASPAVIPTPTAIPEKSIAVLPFVNLSSNHAEEYLGDGIAAEITTKLSHLTGIKVAARTSVSRFKGAAQSASEIGAALGVGWLLEGSVLRAGDRIRVTTTLLKSRDGFQVWSESADAKIDDIFAVQERIATHIVEALALKLTPDERRSLADWGTRNAAAYDEYLHGQALYATVHDRARFEASRPHFERALVIDPQFAPALAGLASVEAQEYRDFDTDPARLAKADDLVHRALEIDPHLGRALMAAGEIHVARYEYDDAAASFAQVTTEEPGNYVAWDLRCWAEGYRTPPHAAEAEEDCRRALQLNAGHANAYYHLERALLLLGRIAEAGQALGKLDELQPGSELGSSGQFWLELYEGRPREALSAANRSAPTPLTLAWTAMAHAQLTELDAAFANLDKALAGGYRDRGELRSSRWFAPLRQDRRFETLLAKYGLKR